MLSNDTVIGANHSGTSFADIIINNDNAVADGLISGFAQFVHDPKYIADTVNIFNRQKIPSRFAEAVILRRIETQQLDNIWNFPLNLSCPTTIPLPWTIVDATEKQRTEHGREYNLMRIIDFIGRNYVRLYLPSVNTLRLHKQQIVGGKIRRNDTYLGSWHRDLIPRIISKVSFYPRSNCHVLFSYTGYDIFVHNILFGNAQKQMNDLMAGEDMFELCYDPYRVHGSALGIASYKGIDNVSNYRTQYSGTSEGKYNWLNVLSAGSGGFGQDGFIDEFQLDTYMNNKEFREIYTRNVWYEAPIAKNYGWRHSIHSRRFIHAPKIITFPLDILPFGYSIASSLPSAALAGDCGYIQINIDPNWFNNAFYLTKLSDVPFLYPVVNHTHYVANDALQYFNSITTSTISGGGQRVPTDSPLIGWVNPLSIGRYGDQVFQTKLRGSATSALDKDDFEVPSNIPNSGQLVNGPDMSKLEGVVYSMNNPLDSDGNLINNFNMNGPAQPYGYTQEGGTVFGRTVNAEEVDAINDNNTSATFMDFGEHANNITSLLSTDPIALRPSSISATWGAQYKPSLGIKLLQVGYQTLPCVREFLVKLPNIYITTEWSSSTYGINNTDFNINNDLYIQAILFWFIPIDAGSVRSMRMYPCHTINHEMPVIPGISMNNEQAQGTTLYTWDVLNLTTPHLLGLPNPLLDNMGIIAFTSQLTSNKLCLAYYDSNISGYLKCRILPGDQNGVTPICNTGTSINLKAGELRAVSIGINGVASVNLNLFRLIF